MVKIQNILQINKKKTLNRNMKRPEHKRRIQFTNKPIKRITY